MYETYQPLCVTVVNLARLVLKHIAFPIVKSSLSHYASSTLFCLAITAPLDLRGRGGELYRQQKARSLHFVQRRGSKRPVKVYGRGRPIGGEKEGQLRGGRGAEGNGWEGRRAVLIASCMAVGRIFLDRFSLQCRDGARPVFIDNAGIACTAGVLTYCLP